YREVNTFKEAPVKDIVSLHQMELPVTQKNLEQFSLYQNNQHYLSNTFDEIGKAIGEQIRNWLQEGNTEKAGGLLQKLEHFFGTIEEQGSVKNGNNLSQMSETTLSGNEETGNNIQNKVVVSEEMLLENETTKKEQDVLQKNTLPENRELDKDTFLEEKIAKSGNERKEVTQADLLRQLYEDISMGKDAKKIQQKFEKLWGKIIEKKWMLEPEMIEKKEKVQEFYEKLSRQVTQLEAIFEQAAGSKNSMVKALQNTASNLEFMNQLNHFQGYIQIPLKMTNQNTNGELYVFANKKNLNKQDGKVTALLHLDMENLGKMDVYVALENKKVSTNFYLEKEEYLDFLEQHMDMLTQRLNKRGYTCEIKTSLRKKENDESFIKKIEKENSAPMLLSMQAFDMRA
ncbi:MAG: flagellar hook-length control protein FliK, partial [Treponema sp.]|nr:flagellar hook-length control protein FliK [Treponema sp.]